ncbi:Cys/Met metabolism pyridoxal-phosphate-dependent enzyme [Thecamonas trahens ATCC 50062]|uniref:Cys/Met metabolism pyridoxal-phosphate-dependent enzyme n=1 Tax=Thecamonas trahens ATCC 50062 TaxID=461836 RepID=A0A0L0DFT1_THETB|nr:Cys/Met metabolism pyridoxal-phosphate-dependent enzyme [Thecamonas trahens ATCC 50062]KNC51187.1 Cys/Met metabolism pyridoxal-phosphate-dependent enzyme [Thecamonas trahens ATCC 50062]|eukprot:XP_013756388.1 Cys/Met metabolism pyridoxal-phosphate-dependent enzyme [Thecamonas trahens ATCC 50062]
MQTRVVHADDELAHALYRGGSGDIAPPLHASTTFSVDNPLGFAYARTTGTPVTARVEAVLSELEGGFPAVVFASGLAATHAALEALTDLHGYHGSQLVARARCGGRKMRLVVVEDIEDALDAGELVLDRRCVVWAETPSNPFNTVVDVEALAERVHLAGGLLAVDATFATPYTLRPLAVGADMTVHSATKYLGGHSDVLAGVAAAADPELVAGLQRSRLHGGACLGALETWLLLRSLRTFPLRIKSQCASATAMAAALADHPRVATVWHASLESHPSHARAVRSMTSGFGAVVTIDVGSGPAAEAFVAHLKLFANATSLGGAVGRDHRAGRRPPLCWP